jgi:hypothetical protein
MTVSKGTSFNRRISRRSVPYVIRTIMKPTQPVALVLLRDAVEIG